MLHASFSDVHLQDRHWQITGASNAVSPPALDPNGRTSCLYSSFCLECGLYPKEGISGKRRIIKRELLVRGMKVPTFDMKVAAPHASRAQPATKTKRWLLHQGHELGLAQFERQQHSPGFSKIIDWAGIRFALPYPKTPGDDSIWKHILHRDGATHMTSLHFFLCRRQNTLIYDGVLRRCQCSDDGFTRPLGTLPEIRLQYSAGRNFFWKILAACRPERTRCTCHQTVPVFMS